jgi:4-carboxymuconolactone decarboxylase
VSRLAPLPPEEWDDDVRRSLAPLLPADRANPRDAGNILGTLVRSPALTRAFLTFNAYLLRDSTLPARLREVALLRIVHRHANTYLWDHHVPIARRTGLTDAEIEGVRRGEVADRLDGLVADAVDQLDDGDQISDATWAALSEHLDEPQRMDLVFVVGTYAMLAQVVATFGIEDEAGPAPR